jgi:O-antigen ligase
MALGSSPITLIAALAAFVVAILWPMAGLVIVAFTAPLVPPDVIPSPGFDTVLVGALLFGSLLRLPIERPRFAPSPALMLIVAFALFVFAQQLPEMLGGWTEGSSEAAGYAFLEIATGTGAIVAAALILRHQRPVPVLAALLAAAGFAAVLAVLVGGDPTAAPSALRNLLGRSEDVGRATGPFVNPNYFGAFMSMALVLTAGLLLVQRSRAALLSLLAIVPVLGAGLVLSMSRGAFATLLAGLTALIFARSPRHGVILAAAGVLAVLIIYPVFIDWRLSNEQQGRTTTAAYLNQAESDDARFGVVATVVSSVARAPVFGVGPGQFVERSAELDPGGRGLETHNWYLRVLAEQGAVGFVMWSALLLLTGLAILARPPGPKVVGAGLFGSFVVASLFLQPPASYQFSALPLLVLVACLVADWPSPKHSNGREDAHVRTKMLTTPTLGVAPLRRAISAPQAGPPLADR